MLNNQDNRNHFRSSGIILCFILLLLFPLISPSPPFMLCLPPFLSLFLVSFFTPTLLSPLLIHDFFLPFPPPAHSPSLLLVCLASLLVRRLSTPEFCFPRPFLRISANTIFILPTFWLPYYDLLH